MGDSFLREMWTTIIGTKNKAKLKNSLPPYIFDKYNVLPLYAVSSSLNKSCLGRMYNQFIDGLNENPWLPRYVIFLLDKDIIEVAHHNGFGCKQVFAKILTWFGLHIESAFEVRKDDLCGKRSGAFLQDATIIWVKMVARPYIRSAEKTFVFAQYNTFNSVLQSVMHRFANTRVISLYFPDDPSLFDATGLLSSNGENSTDSSNLSKKKM